MSSQEEKDLCSVSSFIQWFLCIFRQFRTTFRALFLTPLQRCCHVATRGQTGTCQPDLDHTTVISGQKGRYINYFNNLSDIFFNHLYLEWTQWAVGPRRCLKLCLVRQVTHPVTQMVFSPPICNLSNVHR